MASDRDAELAAAMVAALADLTVIEKSRTAKIVPKSGSPYSYGYADLADIVKTTRPVLAKHGIVALTPVHAFEGGLACSVVLIHSSGVNLRFDPFPFPHGVDARATGSMVTYHRRYALVAALGLAIGEEDDDGAAAVARHAELEPPVPGFRSSLLGAIEKLSEAEKVSVKEFMAEHNLPAVKRMDAAQADLVADWIMHGIPKVEGESEGSSWDDD